MEIDRSALIQTFLAEAQEQLDGMDEGLAALATRPADAQVLRNVFLLAHTLKGSAATVGLDGVTELARAMKDAADNRRRQVTVTPELLTLLGQTVSAIRRALPSPGGNAPAPSQRMPAWSPGWRFLLCRRRTVLRAQTILLTRPCAR